MASLHLDGITVEWYYVLKRDVGLIPWQRFSDFINMPPHHNGLGDLKDLWRTGTVEAYQRQFLTLLCCWEDMTPLQHVQMFSARLGEPLCTDIELVLPFNLQSAMSLVQAYEWRLVVATTDS
jgi:hypothetical protein